ncbi:acyl-CoA dehydrogenase family protein [Sphingomonas hankyongi]|uniref:Acyl-CoA/acyl-ACP dehydrogenase n=1 Tax=Sphingomonas hankyongi TaxID=2908209 RepID=A0ABT0RYZ8_9SPHN|nr:acyl-CoA dehydrogenase family protein [Sphingomonas hankyongi]MCL6728828.1 acyl-CoA/acyl-ACP dehydrogenase [Sphingomonas hankyongi]
MSLLTDDQKMLQETAASFLREEGAISKQLRHWRDTGCTDGYGTALWKQFGDLGLTGICIPEDPGGLGLGALESALVLEEVGRNLTPSPFLASAVVGTRAIEGTAHADRWYPAILSGEAVLTLAVDENKRHAPLETALKAERRGNGFVLNGSKQFVVHGNSADMVVTAARTSGSPGQAEGLTLFAIPKGSAQVETASLVDSSKAARLVFEDVAVDSDAVIGEVDKGWSRLSRALDAGRAGAAAELVGVAAGATAMTLDYLRQRKQFGKTIGEFQALQHRAAHLYGEIEIARAAALKAAQLIDSGDEKAELHAAVAKAKAASVASLAVREGVQMHGGIGMTDEHDIGLFMKRSAVLGELFGDVYYHRNRVAELSGY